MRYMLLIYVDESVKRSPAQRAAIGESLLSWAEEMQRRGVRVHGGPVRRVGDVTTVRVRNGETLVTGGPFAETKEQIGGYDVIDCADLDEALEVASKHPAAAFATIEVRPFLEQ